MNILPGFTLLIVNHFRLINKTNIIYIKSSIKRFSPVFLLLLMIHCASEKQEISDLDVHKIIERVSYTRFTERLDLDDPTKIKSDRDLFLEACEIYRFSPTVVLEKIKDVNPPLYQRFKDETE